MRDSKFASCMLVLNSAQRMKLFVCDLKKKNRYVPPGVGCKAGTLVRTVVAFGTVEDLVDNDAL